MAKELPYFRFTVQEWQNGNISLERYELRGLFIEVCSYYWIKDCSITQAMLKKRFSNAVDMVSELIKLDIITTNKNDDFIKIKFLDDQFDMLSARRKKRQKAGAKGGRSKPKAMLKQRSSYKDKDNNKDKDKSVKKEARPIFKKWINYRKELKKPIIITDTLDALVKRFNSETVDKINWVVSHSIQNQYQGLFWDKYNNQTKTSLPKKEVNYYLYRCPVCQKEFKKREKKAEDVGGYECDEKKCQELLTNNQYRGHYLKLKDIILKKEQ